MSSAYQCGVSLGAMIGVQLPSQGSVDLFDMLGRMNPQVSHGPLLLSCWSSTG
jgi:hypothetical protein